MRLFCGPIAYLDDSELHDFLLVEIDTSDSDTNNDIFDKLGQDSEDDNIPLAHLAPPAVPAPAPHPEGPS